MSELEEVSADEVAELERIAEEAAKAAKPYRGPEATINVPVGDGMQGRAGVHPPPPLRSFVDVATVEAHLLELDTKLTRIDSAVQHVMTLVMVLADRLRVSKQEYLDAEAKIRGGPR